MYQPGETVYFRSLTLDRSTLTGRTRTSASSTGSRTSQVRDQAVAEGSTALWRKTRPARLSAASTAPTVSRSSGIGCRRAASSTPTRPAASTSLTRRGAEPLPARRSGKFIVNQYQKPRLNKELDFNRKTYGAGDEVQARCKATRATTARSRTPSVEATVLIDGQTYGADGKPSAKPLVFTTDDEGTVTVRFKLPAIIDKGQASLYVKFTTAPTVETHRPHRSRSC